MYEWNQNIQRLINRIEISLKNGESYDITLINLSEEISYSSFHMTRHFRKMTGMLFRDYLRLRKLAYSVIDLRDSQLRIIDIAMKYGFSSQEAFTRAFRNAYSITPNAYRKHPKPLLLRTKISAFDPYYLGIGENHMNKTELQEIKIWIEKIPAHKILFIKNYESKGYWDFWEKQSKIPGHDCETICGLLESIKGKLDGNDNQIDSGQIMFYQFEKEGRVPECYGVRVPADYHGIIPNEFQCEDVPEGDYIIFAHPVFDYETMSDIVCKTVDEVALNYSVEDTDYEYEEENGRVRYLYHSPEFWGYRIVRPIKRK